MSTWPSGDVPTTNIDQDTDDPALGILDIKTMADRVNSMMNARGAASGVASLDSSTLVPASQLRSSKGALVYASAAQSIPNNTATSCNWNTESYDTDSFHDTSTNNERLTVPAGVTRVRLHASVWWAGNSSGQRTATFAKNGSQTFVGNSYDREGSPPTNDMAQEIVSPILSVTASDYFEVQVSQNSGGALNANGSTVWAWFFMEVIG